ncbi:MAG: EamA family transporter [Candidatus Hodarchaeales archaeon]
MASLLIPLAFLSAIAYSFSALSIKSLIYYMKNPVHILLYQMLLNFLFILIIGVIMIFLGFYPIENITLENLILIIFSTTFLFIGVVSLYYGLKVGNVSVGGLILSSRVLISIFFAISILGEHFALIIYFWILIIFLGIIFTSWQENLSLIEGIKDSGTIYFFITIIFWGFANTIIGAINNEVFIITFLLIRLFVMCVLIIVLYPFLNSFIGDGGKIQFSFRYVIFIFLFVLVATVGDAASIIALGDSVTVTEAIGAFQGVIIFIIVLILSKNIKLKDIFGEPLGIRTLVVRSSGIIIATLAIILLTFEFSNLNV